MVLWWPETSGQCIKSHCQTVTLLQCHCHIVTMSHCGSPGFVLVGRALEERAKLQASSDMAALQGLMPRTARLALGSTTGSSDLAAAAAELQHNGQQQQQHGAFLARPL